MTLSSITEYTDLSGLSIGGDFQMGTSSTGTVGRLSDLSRVFSPAPGNPTASEVLDRTSLRAINGAIANAGAGKQLLLLGARINPAGASGVALFVCDYLNISGGMSGTEVLEQTTNLPTATLTRYTSGAGVRAAVIIHTAVGTQQRTLSVSYTNQAGTSGRLASGYIGGTGQREIGSVLPLVFDGADTGVRSVQSVTISDTTGTTGNFGILLYKPLAMVCCNNVEGANVIDAVSTGGIVGSLAAIENDACLSLMAVWPAAQVISGAILIGEA